MKPVPYENPSVWHTLPGETIFTTLQAATTGLSDVEAARRLAVTNKADDE